MTDLKTQAIQAALRQDWDTAIKVNQELIREDPEDIQALNRLAFALMETGKLDEAKKNYQKILKLDSFNPIAQKNLNKLTSLRPRSFKKRLNLPDGQAEDIATLFLEEIGKTKVVKLKNLAESYILAQLRIGDEVLLSKKRRGIVVIDKNNIYLGALPDDLSHRLIQLTKHGNKYKAFIKSVDKNSLILFVKETERGIKFKNQPSFSNAPLTYLSSVRDEVFEGEEKPNVSPLEDEDEEEKETQESESHESQ